MEQKSNPYIDLRSFDAYHLTLVFVLGAIPTSIEESIHLNVRGFVGTGKGTRLASISLDHRDNSIK